MHGIDHLCHAPKNPIRSLASSRTPHSPDCSVSGLFRAGQRIDNRYRSRVRPDPANKDKPSVQNGYRRSSGHRGACGGSAPYERVRPAAWLSGCRYLLCHFGLCDHRVHRLMGLGRFRTIRGTLFRSSLQTACACACGLPCAHHSAQFPRYSGYGGIHRNRLLGCVRGIEHLSLPATGRLFRIVGRTEPVHPHMVPRRGRTVLPVVSRAGLAGAFAAFRHRNARRSAVGRDPVNPVFAGRLCLGHPRCAQCRVLPASLSGVGTGHRGGCFHIERAAWSHSPALDAVGCGFAGSGR